MGNVSIMMKILCYVKSLR